ncbi:hypothetical protein MIND_01289200 [Mycena indigotica]|uniref:Uncharacterized protein n=1 Tax=Mycena indigotica TaxID=2126181 RepID=A0A8H6S2B4_9AGAR|nr:uncharacterized protein MIND_01289200 [Mycena indigotica]KAF7291441.1 hypothetical protein MIND_01289200 [Mycena indigotica]
MLPIAFQTAYLPPIRCFGHMSWTAVRCFGQMSWTTIQSDARDSQGFGLSAERQDGPFGIPSTVLNIISFASTYAILSLQHSIPLLIMTTNDNATGVTSSTPKIVWKKQSAHQYRAAGLKDDPHRAWIIENLYPDYVDAIKSGRIDGKRDQYAKTTLLHRFDAEFDFTGKNYNMGDFANTLATILSNQYANTDRNRPAAGAETIFEKRNKVAITEAANSARLAAAAQGGSTKNGVYYQSELNRLFAEATSNEESKAELEAAAETENELLRNGLTADTIAE